jgi:Na+-transporting methylmalonyl-CoA/oxaloacetate decarboxylase gamma subunit
MWKNIFMTDPTIPSIPEVTEAVEQEIHVALPDQLLLALIGYGIVFVGLIALMLVVIVLGKALSAKVKSKRSVAVAEPVQVEEIPTPEAPLAPGSAGELKLYDTPPKTAAMLMAIVADQMGKPLNELRFISIKEVK